MDFLLLSVPFLLLYRAAESKIIGLDNAWFKLATSLLFFLIVSFILLLGFKKVRIQIKINDLFCGGLILFLTCLSWFIFFFQQKYYAFAGYKMPNNIYLYIGLTFLFSLIILWGLFKGNNKLVMVALLTIFLCFWIVTLVSFPIVAQRSDMLPVIKEAGLSFLNGKSPYQIYTLFNGQELYQLPLAYLPMIWIPYLPLVFSGLDLRILSILALILTAFLFEQACRKIDFRKRLIFLSTLFLLNPYILYRHEVYTYFFLFIFALFLVFLIKDKTWPAAVLFGLSVSARQTMLILIPVLLVYLLKKYGFKKTITLALVTSAVLAITVLPFFASSPTLFKYGVFDWFQRDVKFATPSALRTAFNFSSLFGMFQLGELLQPLQAILIIIITAHACFFLKDKKQLLAYLTFAYLVFLMFNPHLMGYMYLSLLPLLFLYLKETESPND